jgi:hypothetical protein
LVWHENDIPALGSALHRIAGKAGRAAQSSGLRGSARHGTAGGAWPSLSGHSLALPVVARQGQHRKPGIPHRCSVWPSSHSTARLAGAATLAEGNALLPTFIADYNGRFGKAPANNKDLHRPLRAGDNLDDAFAWKEERALSQALTLQYDKVIFILEPSEQAKAAIGKRVTVVDYPDGRLAIRHRGVALAYRTFDKILAVDPRCALVRAALGIGMRQNIVAADLVVQGVEAIASFCLRFRV